MSTAIRLPSIILFFLFLFTSCASQKTIVNGLDEKEANEILVYLSGKGIEAQKMMSKEGGGTGATKLTLWDIVVAEDEAREAMSLLNQAGLPRRKPENLLNIFSNTGLVPSEATERVRYQAGLAAQIASTIRKIDGILDADIQISFPEEDPLNPQAVKKKITASVYVKHSGVLDDPNSHLVSKIKRLVSASVTGLDFDDVTVIGDRARYSDVFLPGGGGSFEEEKPFVSVWSVIVAKESLFRFRILFFAFILIIVFLILSLVWISWKIYPLLETHGGAKELFTLHPIGKSTTTTSSKEAASSKKESQENVVEESEEEKIREGQEAIESSKPSDSDET